MLLSSFARRATRDFAAGSGVFLHQAFFDGFIVFALDFFHVFGSRGSLEGFKGEFDVAFDVAISCGAFRCLTSGLFGGFNNRH